MLGVGQECDEWEKSTESGPLEYWEWDTGVQRVGQESGQFDPECVRNIYGEYFWKNIIRMCFLNIFCIFLDYILFMVHIPFD